MAFAHETPIVAGAVLACLPASDPTCAGHISCKRGSRDGRGRQLGCGSAAGSGPCGGRRHAPSLASHGGRHAHGGHHTCSSSRQWRRAEGGRQAGSAAPFKQEQGRAGQVMG